MTALRLVTDLDPEVVAMRDTIVGLEATVRKQARQIGALERDEQGKAEVDPNWVLAQRLFDYHCKLSGHESAEWSVARFKLVRAKLKKRNGLEACLRAIAGCLADDWRVEHSHTTFDHVFGTGKDFDLCVAKCPADWSMPKGAQ